MKSKEDEEILKELGKRLYELRKKKKISLRMLYYKSDVDISKLSKLEKGLVNPTFLTLRKLAHGLGVDIKEIFDYELL